MDHKIATISQLQRQLNGSLHGELMLYAECGTEVGDAQRAKAVLGSNVKEALIERDKRCINARRNRQRKRFDEFVNILILLRIFLTRFCRVIIEYALRMLNDFIYCPLDQLHANAIQGGVLYNRR